ncbi:MAG: hypothetical protein JWP00_1722 [Chloroflexi bacterium]|nr:hypothetical protein [Chloroflexota bacterium]
MSSEPTRLPQQSQNKPTPNPRVGSPFFFLLRPVRAFGILESAILALGILVIGLLLTSLILVSETYVQQSRLDVLINELKVNISLAHIWSEQAMAGDPNINFKNDVKGNLDKSLGLCNVFMDGGQIRVGNIDPVTDPKLLKILSEMCLKIKGFNELTLHRWDENLLHPGNLIINQNHDQGYKEAISLGIQADELIDRAIIENQLRQIRINSGIVFFLTVIFIGMVILVKLNRRILKAQTMKLEEKEEQYRSIFQATSDGVCLFDQETLGLVEANDAFYNMHGYTPGTLIGERPATWLFPQLANYPEEALSTIKSSGLFKTDVVHLRKDGTKFYAAVHCSLFNNRGKPHILVVIRDVTERIESVQVLEHRVAERTQELYTLLQVSQDVASTLEKRPLLRLILDQLKQLVDYSGATIFNLEKGKLDLVDQRGNLSYDQSFKLGQAIAKIERERESTDTLEYNPIIVDHLTRDLSQLDTIFKQGIPLDLCNMSGAESLLYVPLIVKDQLIGGLILLHQEPYFYTMRHSYLAQAIASQAAVALENARLYKRAQELAMVEERQRLARELHDSVTQAIYGIALGAQTAYSMLEDGDTTDLRMPLEYMLTLSEASLAEMRLLIFAMRPENLEKHGLVAGLSSQAATLRMRHKIEVKTVFGTEPALSLDAKHALYRIVEEAFNNIVKHAHATEVFLLLKQVDDVVFLEIKDNGTGFDVNGFFPGHMGLSIMRERVTKLGGAIDLTSSPGNGAALQVRIPILLYEMSLQPAPA